MAKPTLASLKKLVGKPVVVSAGSSVYGANGTTTLVEVDKLALTLEVGKWRTRTVVPVRVVDQVSEVLFPPVPKLGKR